jgi:hypothetical protein
LSTTLLTEVGTGRPDVEMEDAMKRFLLALTTGLLAAMTLAGPVGARDFGAVYGAR